MSIENRYEETKKILGGTAYGTSLGAWRVYNACANNTIGYSVELLTEAQRVDQLAGMYYGSAKLWWVIAAASGIGWALQCPAGTRIVIPSRLQDIEALVG
jgi:hypothetical protein